jgi:hypothetical protein
MRYLILSAFAGSWLFVSPLLWTQRPVKAVLGAVVGLLAMALSPLGAIWSPARRAVAVSGMALALSNFIFFDGVGTVAAQMTASILFIIAGLAPSVKRVAVAAPSAKAEPFYRSAA